MFYATFNFKGKVKSNLKSINSKLMILHTFKLNTYGSSLEYAYNSGKDSVELIINRNAIKYRFYFEKFDETYYLRNFTRFMLLLKLLSEDYEVDARSLYSYLFDVFKVHIDYVNFNDKKLDESRYIDYIRNLSDQNYNLGNEIIRSKAYERELVEKLNLYEDFINQVMSKPKSYNIDLTEYFYKNYSVSADMVLKLKSYIQSDK